jgi:hypothetical protein
MDFPQRYLSVVNLKDPECLYCQPSDRGRGGMSSVFICLMIWIYALYKPVCTSYPSGKSVSQSIPQKPQESLRNGDTIMLSRRPLHGIPKRPVGYDAGLVARPKHFSHHELGEFGVSLHRDKSPGYIHGLGWAILGMCQRYDGRRILGNHIAVCLVNFLWVFIVILRSRAYGLVSVHT